jgi:hypothetical protein
MSSFARYIPKLSVSGSGAVVGALRRFSIRVISFQQSDNCNFVMEYDPANTGSTPDQMTLVSTALLTFATSDYRAKTSFAESNLSTGYVGLNFKIPASGALRTFQYNSNAALSPANRTINYIFRNPLVIKAIAFIDGNSGSNISGTFAFPYLQNLESFYLDQGANAITSITERFPENLKYFALGVASGTNLSSIQRAFPQSLLGLILPCANSTLASGINTLIANLSNLLYLLLINEPASASATQVVNTNGKMPVSSLTIVSASLKALGVASASLTAITYSFTTLEWLTLYGCTSLNSTTFKAIVETFFASSNQSYLNIGTSNLTWSRNIGASDIKSSCVQVHLHGNIITGTISLSASRPNLIAFTTGQDTTSITSAASKNNLGTVDVSGATAVALLDLSNSQIVNLTLPANTVCTELGLGGNKLDTTVNTSLLSQILAMSALTTLFLSAGSTLSNDIENGQNSTNGFGANRDFSALTNLTFLQANNVKLSGSLKIPTSLQTLSASFNSLTSIAAGTISSLTNIQIENNASFDFDFTRVPNITRIVASNCAIVTCDLSGRTATTQWNGTVITVTGNSLLTSITFPTTQARCVLSAGGTSSINIGSCPLLATVNNLENINYSSLTGANARNFVASGCALNQDLKIGVNNFLPTVISIQNNGMSNANVDTNIGNIYTNRSKWSTTTVSKSLNIAGTNATPSGTYQAPTGFVLGSADGTPASAKEQAYVLVNNYGWTITMN